MIVDRFRIVPVLPDRFIVQEKRRWWFGWKTCGYYVTNWGDSVFFEHYFTFVESAKSWIDREVDRRAEERDHMEQPHVYVTVIRSA